MPNNMSARLMPSKCKGACEIEFTQGTPFTHIVQCSSCEPGMVHSTLRKILQISQHEASNDGHYGEKRHRLIDTRETALRSGIGRVRVRHVRRVVALVVRLSSCSPYTSPESRAHTRRAETAARERRAGRHTAHPGGRAWTHAPSETFKRIEETLSACAQMFRSGVTNHRSCMLQRRTGAWVLVLMRERGLSMISG